MNREPSFPFDWLAPGERRYCNCGFKLLPAGVAACADCSARMGRTLTGEERVKLDRSNAEIEAATERTARDRRDAGVPPLFWMGPADGGGGRC